LKQSFLYLIGYFLLGDSLNTTVTVIATLQVRRRIIKSRSPY
jgi:hypothetical protein